MEEITYEFKIKTPQDEADSIFNTLVFQLQTLNLYLENDTFTNYKIIIENQNMLIDRMKATLDNLKIKEVE